MEPGPILLPLRTNVSPRVEFAQIHFCYCSDFLPP